MSNTTSMKQPLSIAGLIDGLSWRLADVTQREPEMTIEARGDHVKVFLWMDADTGRELVLGSGSTFSSAYTEAVALRKKKLADCKIEAQIRAEITSRMAEAERG